MNQKIEMIRQLAYYIWEQEGRPPDRALQNWLQAESTVDTSKTGVATASARRKSAKRSTGTNAAKQAKTAKASAKKGTAADKAKKKAPKKTTKRTRKKS
jgi:hypothetical protein